MRLSKVGIGMASHVVPSRYAWTYNVNILSCFFWIFLSFTYMISRNQKFSFRESSYFCQDFFAKQKQTSHRLLRKNESKTFVTTLHITMPSYAQKSRCFLLKKTNSFKCCRKFVYSISWEKLILSVIDSIHHIKPETHAVYQKYWYVFPWC
jgi:hypothetical protein